MLDVLLLREKEQTKKDYAEKRAAAKSGFVYLIHLFDDYYKIGKSANPENRLKSIISIAQRLTGIDVFEKINPVLISEIRSFDMGWAEAKIHEKFDAFRDRDLSRHSYDSYGLTTEIFRLSQNDVQWFMQTEVLNPKWFSAEWIGEELLNDNN